MRTDQPLVSVIMPLYNTANYVGASIHSILSQTYQNFELVIVNDCSTDNSEEVVQSFKDDRIKYHTNTENKGIVYTRNKAIDLTNGEYIAFLDSDDLSHPERLEIQLKFLESNKAYGFVGTEVTNIDSAGNPLVTLDFPSDHELIKSILIFKNCFCASSVVFRREAIIKHRFNSDFPVAEDYEMYLNILDDGWRCGNINKQLTQYRIHGLNITNTKRQLLEDRDMALLKRQLAAIGLLSYSDKALRYYFLTGKTDNDIYYQELLDYQFDDVNEYLNALVNANATSNYVNGQILVKHLMFQWHNSFVAIRKYSINKYKEISKTPFFKILPIYKKNIFFFKCLFCVTKNFN